MTLANPSILHLDIEGGSGGSSRSLLYLLQAYDRSKYDVSVWHRKPGPISDQLQASGIQHRLEPDIFSVLPISRNNLKQWIVESRRLPGMIRLARRLVAFSPNILHLNYEGLVPLHWMATRFGLRSKTVLHFRTTSPANAVYRAYAGHINSCVDHLIFITENERESAALAGVRIDRIPNTVLHNTVARDLLDAPVPEGIGRQPDLRGCFLGTLDPIKGPDRLIEIAGILKSRNAAVRIDAFGGSPLKQLPGGLSFPGSTKLKVIAPPETVLSCSVSRLPRES